eukprot:scaffold285106_cov17-Tisochrysis_lutea.AAC.1
MALTIAHLLWTQTPTLQRISPGWQTPMIWTSFSTLDVNPAELVTYGVKAGIVGVAENACLKPAFNYRMSL